MKPAQREAALNMLRESLSAQGLQLSLDIMKRQLLSLVELFVGTLRDTHAAIRMDEIAAHLDDTWFAWVGADTDDAVFYYRIHNPVVLIEFDHQFPVGTSALNPRGEPTRDHIHVVIRTPNGNDYGKSLLQQHLVSHPHSIR